MCDEDVIAIEFFSRCDVLVSFSSLQTLYERILSAKVNLVSGESKWRSTKDASSDPYERWLTGEFVFII